MYKQINDEGSEATCDIIGESRLRFQSCMAVPVVVSALSCAAHPFSASPFTDLVNSRMYTAGLIARITLRTPLTVRCRWKAVPRSMRYHYPELVR
jgi:hypothetical protein